MAVRKAELLVLIAAIWSFQENEVLCQQTSDGFLCHASTDCQGHVISDWFNKGDCCASGSGGLSFSQSDTCGNCFTYEAFTSLGTDYYVAFPNNFEFPPLLSSANLRLKISFNESDPADVAVFSRSDVDGKVTTSLGRSAEVEVDIGQKLSSITERNKGIRIKSEKEVSVVALSEELSSADMFLVLPPVYLPDQYEYYAVSIEKDENETIHKSALLIVASEGNTSITMTLTQNISISEANDIIGSGIPGEPISVTLNEMDTLYVSSFEDLSGSRVVANKPITFISGHECGKLPAGKAFCDQMFEQIPPTSTWGKTFYTAPLKSRESYDVFMFVASADDTTITAVCNPPADFTTLEITSAGGTTSINVLTEQFCSFTSNKPVLLIQSAVATSVDNVNADPFMMIIPPCEQYRNQYLVSTFQPRPAIVERYFVNIVIKADSDRELISFNGSSITEPWTEIFCEINAQSPCAYGVQIRINTSDAAYLLSHVTSFGVTVYSFATRVGQGYVAGLNQEPIALDRVYFNETEFEAYESDGVLKVGLNLERSLGMSRDVTVTVVTRNLADPDAAEGSDFEENNCDFKNGIDYISMERDVTFSSSEVSKSVLIQLAEDDVFPEANKTFQVYIRAPPGIYISPTAYATARILNDDEELQVMNISFGAVTYSVSEGYGCVDIVVTKTTGAVGPVSVNLFTVDGTAVAGRHYEPLNTTITFEKDDLVATRRVTLINNQILENSRMFSAVIEVTPGLIFPAQVLNSTAIIEIEDDDMIIIGVNPVTQEVMEGEAVIITVLLFGSLQKEVSVTLTTIDGSAQGENDYIPVSTNVVLSGSSTSEEVFIPTRRDDLLEGAESFSIELTQDEDENVLLLPAQSTVWIIDNSRVIIGFEMTSGAVTEDGGSIDVTVKVMSGTLSAPVSVALSTLSRTAIGGEDFGSIQNRELVFDGERTSYTISIAIYDNPINEFSYKTFSVQLSLMSGVRTRLSPSFMDINITEDDVSPDTFLCHFARDCAGSGFEGFSSVSSCCSTGSSINFTFFPGSCLPCISVGFNDSEYLLREDITNHTVPVSVAGGRLPTDTTLLVLPLLDEDGAGPEDYNLYTSQIFFASSSLDDSITIEAVRDDDIGKEEMFESFRIILDDGPDILPPNVVFGSTVITIEDVVPVIFIERAVYEVTEGETVGVVVASNGEHLKPVTFSILTKQSTAIEGLGSDYGIPEKSFVLQPGQDRVVINISVFNDTIAEPTEIIGLTFVSGSVRGAILDTNRDITQIQIRDNDIATVGFVETSYTIFEDEGQVDICVQLRMAIDTLVQVEFSTTSGSAVHGADLEDFSTVITFAVGDQRSCVAVPIIGDDVMEEEEMFSASLVLLTATDHQIILQPDITVITIIDVLPQRVTIQFQQTSYVVLESVGTITLDVTASGRFEGTIFLQLNTIEVEASDFTDYQLDSLMNISRPLSEFPIAIPVVIIDDCIHEGNETFIIELISEQEGVMLVDNMVFVTILYDLSDDFTIDRHLIIYYLQLGAGAVFLPPDDDTASEAISPPGGFPVFGVDYSDLYVTSNGVITFGDAAVQCCPVAFENIRSGATPFVAPYWIDNDPSVQGNVSYEVHDIGSRLLEDISGFVSWERNTAFNGVWMLIATWMDIPEFFFDDRMNSFQAILITDGMRSYAIFKYNCDELHPLSIAGIGYYINSTLFKEHPLSNTNQSSMIACWKFPYCPWEIIVEPLFLCPSLPDPPNGMVSVPDRSVGGFANYTCNDGFELVGSSLPRRCRRSGVWSGEEPVCRALCPSLRDPINGMVSVRGLSVGDVATYTCNDGFDSFGSEVRVCLGGGIWSGEEPACFIIAQCPRLPDPPNGTVTVNGVSFNSTAVYTCDDGFELDRSRFRICLGSLWSGEEPQCIALCPSLPDPSNGTVTVNDFSEGGTATYTCNDGFELVGSGERVCQSGGVWSGEEPVCRALCPSLPGPPNGTVAVDDFSEGGTATYTCNDRFELIGSGERVCLTGGVWSGAEPVCRALCPSLSDPPNGMVSVSNLSEGGTATYTCNDGFELVGSGERVCQRGGVWSGQEPVCRALCPSLPDPPNGTVSVSNLSEGGVANYTCNDGFELDGVQERVCQSGGVWSGGEPECRASIIVGFAETVLTASESVTAVSAIVMINRVSADPVTVDVEVRSGSATDADYLRTVQTRLTFTTIVTLNLFVVILDDDIVEDTESFTITLSNQQPEGVVINPAVLTIFIIDNEPTQCPSLSDPPNGMVNVTDLSEGGTATYTCNDGYELVGSGERLCQSGVWSGEEPICRALCPSLSDPPNGMVSVSNLSEGSVATYTCNDGFELDGIRERVCQSGGVWSAEQPVCIPLCPSLTDPPNGMVSVTNFSEDGIATYTCSDGFELDGSDERVCQSGVWSGVRPVCIRIPLPVIRVGYEDARYSLNEGEGTIELCVTTSDPVDRPFVLRATTVLGSNSASSDDLSEVDIMLSFNPGDSRACHSISIIDDDICEAPSENFLSRLEIVSGDSIEIEFAFTEVVIIDDMEPECAMCPPLVNPLNGMVSVSNLSEGGVSTYTCNDGFELDGSANRICQSGGIWSGEQPMCRGIPPTTPPEPSPSPVPAMCPPLVNPLNGMVSVSSFSEGSVATYSCNDGFELDSSANRICQSGGIWSGEQPMCRAVLRNIRLGENEVMLPSEDDGASAPIPVRGGIPVLSEVHSDVIVTSNGVIFFDEAILEFEATNFLLVNQIPMINPFIAPYWIDNDPSAGGFVSYEVFTGDSDQLSNVNSFISESENVVFNGTWLLVAEWDQVPVWMTNDTSNTYQAALVTDGSSTFTVYTYECGELISTGGRIGYYINMDNFEEHPLSMVGRSSDIACENEPQSSFNNVVYRLSGLST